ncbi:MAG: pglJ 2 [Bacteroidota bacterium]|nr:pglJ 2 [Bacteroidota bacterium]
MKIAFDAKRALNNGTGLGNHARILLNALLRDYPENEYLLFSPKAKPEFLNELNSRFKIIFPESGLYKTLHPLWRSFGINDQLKESGANIYHGLSNELPFNIHRSGVKTVVTVHDLIFLKHTEQYPWIDRQFYAAKTKYAVKHAYKVIAVSNETKNDLMEIYKVPEKKIEVIYHSVDPVFYRPVVSQPGGTKYILNVGSLVTRKNQKKLIEAFALIADKIDEELWLIGKGNMEKDLRLLIAAKKLEGRVKILTGVKNEELPAFYKNASALVFVSLFEGFGAPVLEALFSGTPVIASKGGAIEEAAGKKSIFVNPEVAEDIAEKILKVLNDDVLRGQMITEGYLHAETMSDKVFAQKTMKVYRDIL